jgi:hypothetical protein
MTRRSLSIRRLGETADEGCVADVDDVGDCRL